LQIFPQWVNRVPLYLAGSVAAFGVAVPLGAWYFFSPRFTDVGYRPVQPVPYSHKLHAGELQIDCRYCHAMVEISSVASVPPTKVCMNCHQLVNRDSEKLTLIRQSASSNQPIQWIRIHKVPEYAHFNHGMHLRAGVGCSTCHGDVAEMEEITQAEGLSMGWCLDCHRKPDPFLRPRDQLTNTKWSASEGQLAFAARLRRERRIDPPTACTGCHR
jgi:hypothetical protein